MQAPSSANVTMNAKIDWHSTNWKKVYRLVNNLKRRIFRAAKEGNLKKVRSLQRFQPERVLGGKTTCEAREIESRQSQTRRKARMEVPCM